MLKFKSGNNIYKNIINRSCTYLTCLLKLLLPQYNSVQCCVCVSRPSICYILYDFRLYEMRQSILNCCTLFFRYKHVYKASVQCFMVHGIILKTESDPLYLLLYYAYKSNDCDELPPIYLLF